MAQVTDYGTLKTYLSTTSHYGTLTSEIPGFIQSAETMIAQKVRAQEMLATVTLQESDRDSGAVYNAPSDFLGAHSIANSDGWPLDQKSLKELKTFSLTGTNTLLYAVYGKKIEFRNSPATDSTFELIYFKKPAAFVSDSDTNDLIGAHPTLYQHAGLHWLHIHTQDLELASAHESAFDDLTDDINALAEEIVGAGGVKGHANFCSRSTM